MARRRRERDALLRNGRQTEQQRLDKTEEVQKWLDRKVKRSQKETMKHVKNTKNSD